MRLSGRFFLEANVQPTISTDYRFESIITLEETTATYPIIYEGGGGISNLGVTGGYSNDNSWCLALKAKNNFGIIIRKEIITTTSELEISRNIRYTGFAILPDFLIQKSYPYYNLVSSLHQ